MHGKARLLDDKGKLIGSCKQTKGNLFYLDLCECSCFIAQVEESWLWDRRLCHVNFDNMVKIREFRKVRGIPNLKIFEKLCILICVDSLEYKVILEKNSLFFLLMTTLE